MSYKRTQKSTSESLQLSGCGIGQWQERQTPGENEYRQKIQRQGRAIGYGLKRIQLGVSYSLRQPLFGRSLLLCIGLLLPSFARGIHCKCTSDHLLFTFLLLLSSKLFLEVADWFELSQSAALVELQ